MNTAADTEKGLSAVPLLNAVFCVDCETITNSPHDACTVCGSRSLVNLFRIVGGTLRSQKTQSDGDEAKTAKYNLELTAKVREIPATELSLVIESMTRLAQACRAVESLRINVETVFTAEGALRAA
jgi:nicotinate-nucleotide pyrophosphorylase